MNLSKALALTLLAALGLTGAVAGHGGTPLDHLVERAAAGDPPAALELGRAYLEGTGVAPDPARGLALLERAAAADLPVAHYLLARHAETAAATPSSHEQALRHYRRAAELGHTTAQARLGELLLARAVDARVDPDDRARLVAQAEGLLVHAADAGNGYAELRLAELVRDGRFGIADGERARRYFERAEGHGQARAAWALARLHLDTTAGDAAEGIRHLALAADGGEPAATRELVQRYLDGDRLPQDLDKARAWLALAERQDSAGAASLRRRVEAFAAAASVEGAGPSKPSHATAGSDAIDGATSSRAPADDPELTDAGAPSARVVPDAPEKPIRSALEDQVRRLEQRVAALDAERERLAVRLGEAEARAATLSAALGPPVTERSFGLAAVARRDYADALSHLQRAAAADDAAAIATLGTLTLRGKGVAADPERAVAHFVRAAGLGDALAALNLAFVYRHGVGVPPDEAAAERWLALAAERGDDRARRHRLDPPPAARTVMVAR